MNLASKILNRARGHGKGWVFTPKHLQDLGTRAAVDQGLHRLVQAGNLRRIARGIYDIPVNHPVLGPLAPNPDTVAKAVAHASGHRVQVSPARAANLLGLSTQVPAQLVYLTDGSSRKIHLGHQVIHFKHAAPRTLLGAGNQEGLAFQALRAVRNSENVQQDLQQLRDQLDPSTKTNLQRLAPQAPNSVQRLISAVAV